MPNLDRDSANSAKYEYGNPKEVEFPKLDGNAKIGIQIPQSIIFDKDCGSMRLAVYSYLYVRRGQDDVFYFSVNTMLNWMHKQIDYHKGRINDKIIELLKYLKKQKYILFDDSVFEKEKISEDGKKQKVNVSEKFFGMKFLTNALPLQNEDDSTFTFIYWDEVLKIMNYKNPDKKDVYVNNDTILLVFAWLRYRIGHRPNEIKESAHSKDWVDAWWAYYKEIAEDLGISERMTSDCIKVLQNLGLIYTERVSAKKLRVKDKEKWRSGVALFANTYKRKGDILLATGAKYYMGEIDKIKKSLRIKTGGG